MKLKTILPFSALLVLGASVISAPAQTVVAGTQTSGDTLPGQGGVDDPDYTFFGPYQPGGGNGSPELTDFSLTQHGFNGAYLPTINAPDGSIDSNGNPITTVTGQSVIVGREFFATDPVDLVDFTVLSSASSSYELSAFFGIVDNGGPGSPPTTPTSGDGVPAYEYVDGSFTVYLDNAAGTVLSSSTLSVTDHNESATTGLYANFTLTGLAAGDVIHVYATPATAPQNVQTPYIGGVGFTPVASPEPSTYAMVLAGMGALLFVARRKLTA